MSVPNNILKLSPSLVSKVWGGHKLKLYKNIRDFDESAGGLGETWEVSCHADGEALFNNQKLSTIIETAKLPYLVKFIDTADNLSIQVHPDDSYATKHENSMGKTESWFILAHEPDCGIYLGLKKGVSKTDLEKGILEKEDISKYLNYIPVSVGDFFFVPAGTIHAIGKGVTLAEVQQSSGITYRVWDWNRLDVNGQARELHVSKSMDVINFDEHKNVMDYFKYQNVVKEGEDIVDLIEHMDFKVRHVQQSHYVFDTSNDKRSHYHSFLNMGPDLEVSVAGESCVLKAYEACVVVRGSDLEVKAPGQSSNFIHIY